MEGLEEEQAGEEQEPPDSQGDDGDDGSAGRKRKRPAAKVGAAGCATGVLTSVCAAHSMAIA